MRPIRKWATAVVAGALILTVAGTASAATVYNNIPSPLAGNYPSQTFEATQTAEFGGLVELASGPRTNPVVTVTMSSQGCQSISGACVTTPGAVFSLPITLNIYAVNAGNSVGSLLASDTQTFKIPFRPSANCTGGGWGTSCYSGLAHNISWDMGGRSVTLPDKVIVSVMYNTSHYGYQPIGPCNSSSVGCGYDSLNVAVVPNTPFVGTDPLPNSAYLSSLLDGAWGYCDSGAGGLGVFRLDAGCWTGYRPAIQVETYAPQAGATGPSGADGATGPAGTNGTDGGSCTVTDNGDGTETISCTDGTSATVSNGTSGSSCAVVDNGDGSKTISCDDGTSATVSDGTNATATPAVAVTRPQTKIAKVKIRAKKHTASFRFSGSGGKGKLGFQCRLDKGKYKSCRSSKTYTHLKPGKHVFRVRAKDASGKLDQTPATRKFKI